MRWRTPLLVAGPALLLALAGLFHPQDLTAAGAADWTNLHLLLLLVFPLLGVTHWMLLRGMSGPLAWLARLAAFAYGILYTALDVLSGIGTGVLVQRHSERGLAGTPEGVDALYAAGNAIGTVGTWCFLAACVATSSALLVRLGRAALPGGLVLVAAAVPFLNSHIYWPVGVLSMLGLAAGFAGLAYAEGRHRPPKERPPTGSDTASSGLGAVYGSGSAGLPHTVLGPGAPSQAARCRERTENGRKAAVLAAPSSARHAGAEISWPRAGQWRSSTASFALGPEGCP